jgi:hypothetical protein
MFSNPKAAFAALMALSSASLVQATTTYGCWSDYGVKFHEDCLVAATSLIMLQTGTDDQTWVPPYAITYKAGGCTARLKATDGGYAIATVNLLASFVQLDKNCQNGYFYYDDGYIDANLQGHTGWKREIDGDDDSEFNVDNSTGITDMPHGGMREWTIEEDITVFPNTTDARAGVHIGSRVAARAIRGTRINSRSSNIGVVSLFRGASFTITGITELYSMSMNMVTRLFDLTNAALTNTGHNILHNGLASPTGSTVCVLAVAVQLGGVYSSWQDLNNALGDSGTDMATFLINAVQDHQSNGYTASVYHCYKQATEDVLFSVIVNLVSGSS